ncbi:sigma-70 family RNA polymerase sigma factor [Mycobacterium sp. pW049]|uniref:sigma-70 family RNA polymerase sigma factor n=1 Tax=[Mycobacterium] bulgaricum TaxID=3238985 RepID=UPI00351BAAB7
MTTPSPLIDGDGDDRAALQFENDVMPLLNSLYWTAWRLTRSHPDAEDLVQETLLRAYSGYASFRPGSNMKAWLTRIMRNQWINSYRRSQRRPAEMLEDSFDDDNSADKESVRTGAQRSAEDRVLDQIPDGKVSDALASMPNGLRIVLYYAHVEGYSYREIADFLDIPYGTVMSRLHRARHRLRDHLTNSTCRPEVA